MHIIFSSVCLAPVLRGDIKYYFADFVRGGEGGTPQIRNPLFAENFSVKGGGIPRKSVTPSLPKKIVGKGGGGTPLTEQIRKVVFDVAPI